MQDVISSKGKKGKKRGSQLRALALIETGQFSGHLATARICGYITHVFDFVVFFETIAPRIQVRSINNAAGRQECCQLGTHAFLGDIGVDMRPAQPWSVVDRIWLGWAAPSVVTAGRGC